MACRCGRWGIGVITVRSHHLTEDSVTIRGSDGLGLDLLRMQFTPVGLCLSLWSHTGPDTQAAGISLLAPQRSGPHPFHPALGWSGAHRSLLREEHSWCRDEP